MKKVILFIFVLMTTAWARDYGQSTDEADKVYYGIAKKALEYRRTIKAGSQDAFATAIYSTNPNTSSRFPGYFKGGVTYIFYTYTNGPSVYVCLTDKDNNTLFCTGSSSWIVKHYYIRRTGLYYFTVHGVSGTGLQQTDVDFIFTKDKDLNDELQYRWPWIPGMNADGGRD